MKHIYYSWWNLVSSYWSYSQEAFVAIFETFWSNARKKCEATVFAIHSLIVTSWVKLVPSALTKKLFIFSVSFGGGACCIGYFSPLVMHRMAITFCWKFLWAWLFCVKLARKRIHFNIKHRFYIFWYTNN